MGNDWKEKYEELVSDLEDEVADLKQQCLDLEIINCSLEQENAELRKDKEVLDWLNKNKEMVRYGKNNRTKLWHWNFSSQEKNIRKAIDKAMKEES